LSSGSVIVLFFVGFLVVLFGIGLRWFSVVVGLERINRGFGSEIIHGVTSLLEFRLSGFSQEFGGGLSLNMPSHVSERESGGRESVTFGLLRGAAVFGGAGFGVLVDFDHYQILHNAGIIFLIMCTRQTAIPAQIRSFITRLRGSR